MNGYNKRGREERQGRGFAITSIFNKILLKQSLGIVRQIEEKSKDGGTM